MQNKKRNDVPKTHALTVAMVPHTIRTFSKVVVEKAAALLLSSLEKDAIGLVPKRGAL